MKLAVSLLLAVVAAIHLLPVAGVVDAAALTRLYGVAVDDPNLAILLRHRAVLFAIVGGVLLYAAFRPALQPTAFVVGLVSVVAFLWLAWSTGGYNAALRTVVIADVVALACLVVAVALYALARRHA